MKEASSFRSRTIKSRFSDGTSERSRSYLEFRESPSKALVLSLEEHFSWESATDLLSAAVLAATRPVALDIVLDLVMPRALGEVGVLESDTEAVLEDEFEVTPPVLGREGVEDDIRDSLLALIVAESTVFCLLKFEVVVWLLFVDMGTAEGGPLTKRIWKICIKLLIF